MMGSLFDNLSFTVIPTQLLGQLMNSKQRQLFRVSIICGSAVAGKAPSGQRSRPWGAMTAGGPLDRALQKALGSRGHPCSVASEFYLTSR